MRAAPELDAALATVVARLGPRLGRRLERDRDIGVLTTYRVGGAAALYADVQTDSELLAVAEVLASTELPVLVLGRGSNLLVSDRGFAGLVVHLGEGFTETTFVDDDRVIAGAAVSLPVLARQTATAGLTGFEWAVGVPGSVGGAVRMNAGGHGSDMAASLCSVQLLDLRDPCAGIRDVPAAALELGYRRSAVGPDEVVVRCELRLARGDRRRSEATIADIVRWRRENQPGGQNAGSVFTNPDGDSAGRLIDDAGCKGLRIGTAVVSEKHANFFQADAGGSAEDIVALMRLVRQRVAEHSGTLLVPETRLVGFGTEPLR